LSGLQYDNLSNLLYESLEGQKSDLYEKLNTEHIIIDNYSIDEIRERIPDLI